MATADSQPPAVGARAARTGEDGARPHGDAAMPGWYRTAAAASWRFLAIAGAVFVVMYALVHLRVIVLPIIVAAARQHAAAPGRALAEGSTACQTGSRP